MASTPSRSTQHASYCKSCSLSGKFQGTSTLSEILFGMTNTQDRSRSTGRKANGATLPSAKAAAIQSLWWPLRRASQVDAAHELAARFGISVSEFGAPASANAEKRDVNLVMPVPADAPAPPATHQS